MNKFMDAMNILLCEVTNKLKNKVAATDEGVVKLNKEATKEL